MSERHGIIPKRLRKKPEKRRTKPYKNLPENDPRKKRYNDYRLKKDQTIED